MIAEEHTIGKTGDERNVIAEPATDHSRELPTQAGSVPTNALRFADPARCAPVRRYNLSMSMLRRLTAVIEREGDGYVALCPQLDIASQGDTIEEARANLTEALTLFFETADASEIDRRFQPDVFITQVEVPVG
jgi:predicted RNase H-like HicB family nuclease